MYLMGSTNQVHIMSVEELCDHICTEGEGDAAVILAPAQHVLVRVGPQQVAEEALVGNVGGTHHPSHLLHGLEVGGKPWRGSTQKTSSHHFSFFIHIFFHL